MVLVGSRGAEDWLSPSSFESNRYELGGLDPQAASVLQQRIIKRHGGHLPADPAERLALDELTKLLGGYPLALSAVLPAVAAAPPSSVFKSLQAGGLEVDQKGAIEAAIEFSFAGFDPVTQNSLLVLAPFTGVIPKNALSLYAGLLKKQTEVEALGDLDLEAAIGQAAGAGFVTPDGDSGPHVRLQPVFPFFLRAKLAERPQLVAAIEQAHADLYRTVGSGLLYTLDSSEPEERAAGQLYAQLEYANLVRALSHELAAGTSVKDLIGPLNLFLDQTHQEFARRQLLNDAIAAVGSPSSPERWAELAHLQQLAGIAALSRHRTARRQGVPRSGIEDPRRPRRSARHRGQPPPAGHPRRGRSALWRSEGALPPRAGDP